jgi:dienelactone hydrolase
MYKTYLSALMIAGTLVGCAVPSPGERARLVDQLVAEANWHPLRLHTAGFTLAAYVPAQKPAKESAPSPATSASRAASRSDTLTVYLEGDGLAWITRSQASVNPTPLEPTALRLALRHPGAAVAYLARPCQYVEGSGARNCAMTYWTDRRFSPEVVAAMDEAVDQLKAHAGARRITLVGFSGGGAIAALVAGGRSDMHMLITVAGNLDTAAWTRHHGITPLKGSLNPADQWQLLRGVRQVHFVGSDDSVVPEEVIRSYINRYPTAQRPKLRVLQGFGHHCCWEQQWADLIEEATERRGHGSIMGRRS